MQEHPKAVGDRTTLAVMLVLESCGFRVYLYQVGHVLLSAQKPVAVL
jgi:hypothetical protein